LFSLVDADELHDVLRLLRPTDVTAGEILFSEGEPGKAMWVLGKDAEVSVTTNQSGRPVAVAYAKAGDVLGEMALVDDAPRSGTAMVTQSGLVHQIDAKEFHSLREMYSPVAYKVLRKVCMDLCQRLRRTNDRIVQSSTHSAIQTASLASVRRPELTLVEQFVPFAHLPQVVKLALTQKLEVVQVEELTPLFAEGEPNDGAYFILEGEVTVGRNGKTLANLGAGNMFGVVACLDSGLRSASCVTTGAALLLRMSDRDFDQLFATGNRFAFQMVDLVARQLVQHVRDTNAMLPSPGRHSGIARPAVDKRVTAEQLTNALPLELEIDLGEFTGTVA
jgi:CRP/FNR family transcriptional regulator, cyclic AMP receptor protein